MAECNFHTEELYVEMKLEHLCKILEYDIKRMVHFLTLF